MPWRWIQCRMATPETRDLEAQEEAIWSVDLFSILCDLCSTSHIQLGRTSPEFTRPRSYSSDLEDHPTIWQAAVGKYALRTRTKMKDIERIFVGHNEVSRLHIRLYFSTVVTSLSISFSTHFRLDCSLSSSKLFQRFHQISNLKLRPESLKSKPVLWRTLNSRQPRVLIRLL